MTDRPIVDDGEFAINLAKELDEILKERLAHEDSKRPPVLTDIILSSILDATVSVAIGNPPYSEWPSNQLPSFELSADKRTEWFREHLTRNNIDNVTVAPRLGPPLDLQVRQGKHVIANVESELGSNRQRADDIAKLTSHPERPLVSIMVGREKSLKHLESTLHSLEAASAHRDEPFINLVFHWPEKAPLNTARPVLTITRGGEECSNDHFLDEEEFDDEDDNDVFPDTNPDDGS